MKALPAAPMDLAIHKLAARSGEMIIHPDRITGPAHVPPSADITIAG